ncbi:MAG: inosine/xanthosine triphosphate pyrophosphatase family protein [Flavobacteriales bacterium]|jgi:inosine/xanthosine triphosphate pyrophosphatase family protein
MLFLLLITLHTKPMQIVFATNNSNKVKEIQALIDGEMDILSLKDVQCFEELPETQEILGRNSILINLTSLKVCQYKHLLL